NKAEQSGIGYIMSRNFDQSQSLVKAARVRRDLSLTKGLTMGLNDGAGERAARRTRARFQSGLRSVECVDFVLSGLSELRPGLGRIALDELIEPLLGMHFVAEELVGVSDIVVRKIELGIELHRFLELLDRLFVLFLLLHRLGEPLVRLALGLVGEN